MSDGPNLTSEQVDEIWANHGEELSQYEYAKTYPSYAAKYWQYTNDISRILGNLAHEVHFASDVVRRPHVWVSRDKSYEAELLLKKAGYSVK